MESVKGNKALAKLRGQPEVVFCKCSVHASVAGIEKYLGSGLIKDIGPVMAKRIVKMFGEKKHRIFVFASIGFQR